MLQHVVVSCSVLQCLAVSCSVLQCLAVSCSVLQCVAECNMRRHLTVYVFDMLLYVSVQCSSVLQCVAVRCSALQCVAVCCSVLQCVAVCVWQCVEMCYGFFKICCITSRQILVSCTRRCLIAWSVVCCSVLQCVAVCCIVLQCVTRGGVESLERLACCFCVFICVTWLIGTGDMTHLHM